MIETAELHRMAAREGLRFDQAEKDYAILWILLGLTHNESRPRGWVFKGGTCLRHCYYPGYRFSEDLDFTCRPDRIDLEAALALLERTALWIQEASGIRMRVREPHTIPGDFQVETPMEYSRGGSRTRGLPLVKIHLTFDEPIMTKQAVRRVRPRYSDLSEFQISSYSKKEIAAEKMRALLQQQKKWPRPRDLYDLWFMLCQTRERLEADEMRGLFAGKCKVRGIQPDIAALISESIYEWNESAWEDLLRPTMKTVPDFKKVWREWLTAFHELFG